MRSATRIRSALTGPVPGEQAHVVGAPELVGELRAHRLHGAGQHHADVAQGQRQRVLVAFDQRAVYVTHGRAEDAGERPAADDPAATDSISGRTAIRSGSCLSTSSATRVGDQRADGIVLNPAVARLANWPESTTAWRA